MARFLPSLRGGSLSPALREGKALASAAVDGRVLSVSEAERLADVERKVLVANYYESLARYGGGGYGDTSKPWSIERAVAEGYERVMWVFKSVNAIAGDSSALTYRLLDDNKAVEDHPLARLLNDGKANPLETGRQLRKRLSAQVLLSKKGSFVEVTKTRGGDLARLDLLPPGRMEIIPYAGSAEDPHMLDDRLIDHYRLQLRTGGYRELAPDTVRWFRDPHPLDPYSGTTPLESLGASIELDYFARIYNVSFMRNDGRPGGVLGVKGTGDRAGDIDPAAMDRIEERFGKGPLEAGKISVITGDLSFADLSGKPRDMAYAETARNAKEEILAGFGLSETVLGRAASKTYENANVEIRSYWTITMPKHNTIITTGFHEDSHDDLRGELDTSGIQVLQQVKWEELAQAREEVTAGVRSIISYARMAGLDDEIEDTAYTRALWVPTGKTPIPSQEDDAAALGVAPPAGEGEAVPPAAADTAAADGAAPGEPAPGGADVGDIEPPTGADAVAAARAATEATPTTGPSGAIAAARAAAGIDRKALLRLVPQHTPRAAGTNVVVRIRREHKERPTGTASSSADDDAWRTLETDVTAALTALAERWTDRTLTRLQSPKTRKGTRHWAAEFPVDTRVGNKALDAPRIVDEQAWQDEAAAAVTGLVTAAAVAAADGLRSDLAPDVDPPPGGTLAVVAATVEGVRRLVVDSARRQAEAVSLLLNRADQDGDPLQTIVVAARRALAGLTGWANGLALHVATATVNGARDAAADALDADPAVTLDQQWVSRKDDRTRTSHGPDGAHGQRRPVREPFLVGGVLLRYPGDPLGPLRETAGCRCRTVVRSRVSGRFQARPTAV